MTAQPDWRPQRGPTTASRSPSPPPHQPSGQPWRRLTARELRELADTDPTIPQLPVVRRVNARPVMIQPCTARTALTGFASYMLARHPLQLLPPTVRYDELPVIRAIMRRIYEPLADGRADGLVDG